MITQHIKRLIILMLLFLPTALRAQDPAAAYIDSFVKKNNFSGVVMIDKNGETVYRKSFGKANLQFGVPNTADTKFKVASITKLFTSVLIMQLYEQGKLDVGKHIIDYLPDYKGEGGGKVTIHHLLTHTSGMQNIDTVSSVESAVKNGLPVYQLPHTSDEILEKYCSGKLVNEPGKTFDYNNAEYIILGKIIGKISGKPYEQVLSENILQPLGMKGTGMMHQEKIVAGLSDTYFFRDDIDQLAPDLPVYTENWYAAGGMYSNAGDLHIFCKALFGGRLLKKETLDKMFISGPGEYGYGVWVYENYDIGGKMYRIVKRPGRIMGAQGMLFHVQGDGTTIIILTNVGNVSLDEFAAEIANKAVKPVQKK